MKEWLRLDGRFNRSKKLCARRDNWFASHSKLRTIRCCQWRPDMQIYGIHMNAYINLQLSVPRECRRLVRFVKQSDGSRERVICSNLFVPSKSCHIFFCAMSSQQCSIMQRCANDLVSQWIAESIGQNHQMRTTWIISYYIFHLIYWFIYANKRWKF